jgi:polyisoprenoid-binding protein YceI
VVHINNFKKQTMKKVIYPIFAALILVTSAFVTVNAVDYKVKDDFSIAFKSKDPNGSFEKMTGTVKFDESDLGSSKFDLSIDVASIKTGNGMMEKKAQTEEWFNASKFPKIKFVSSKIEKSDAGYTITGNLTMKGVTKEIKVPAKLKKSGEELEFTGTFKVNRMLHKVGKSSDAVPDVMNITYSLPVAKK